MRKCSHETKKIGIFFYFQCGNPAIVFILVVRIEVLYRNSFFAGCVGIAMFCLIEHCKLSGLLTNVFVVACVRSHGNTPPNTIRLMIRPKRTASSVQIFPLIKL